jgi:hypothetical protein
MNEREEELFDTNCQEMNRNNEDFYESDESIEKDSDLDSKEMKDFRNGFEFEEYLDLLIDAKRNEVKVLLNKLEINHSFGISGNESDIELESNDENENQVITDSKTDEMAVKTQTESQIISNESRNEIEEQPNDSLIGIETENQSFVTEE